MDVLQTPALPLRHRAKTRLSVPHLGSIANIFRLDLKNTSLMFLEEVFCSTQEAFRQAVGN